MDKVLSEAIIFPASTKLRVPDKVVVVSVAVNLLTAIHGVKSVAPGGVISIVGVVASLGMVAIGKSFVGGTSVIIKSSGGLVVAT